VLGEPSVARGEGFTLFTVNLDRRVKLASNDALRAVYYRATYVTADGWPVVWLAGRKNAKLERATGADLVEPLCQAAAARDLGVYFVGPGPRALAGALEKLTQRFKGLKLARAETPQLPSGNDPAMLSTMDFNARAQRINTSNARLCFVSLGAPRQEILADALAARCPDVGFISGPARRTPLWMQNSKLAWLWCLAANPRRLGVAAGQIASPIAAAEPRGVLR
jgi:N-acetylglucosaminyldiphosphoundecaprenol N-acetyl-beta-D-mannosaminyltransferase